jgi:hypothetical protein
MTSVVSLLLTLKIDTTLISSFFLSIFSSSLGVTRSYVAAYSIKKDRTVSLAILT